jgi:hypothetical protein
MSGGLSDERTGLSFIAVLVRQYRQGLRVWAWHSRSCHNSCSPCYNGSLVTWTVVCLTAAKFKPLVVSMPGFAFSDVANICIFMILYDLCLLPAQFRCLIINIQYLRSHVQLADWCASVNLPVVRRTLFSKRGHFKMWVSASNSQMGQE